MIYKLGILGATGRMGLEIAGLLTDGFEVAGDHFELADAVSARKKLTHVEGVPVRTLDEPPFDPVHCWIDFSRPEATVRLLKTAEVPVVIATTGFSPEDLSAIRAYSEKHPVLVAPNTSPGLNLLLELIGNLPSGQGLDAAIEEAHHRLKKDSPSGTAKALAEALKARGYEAPVTSVRAGGIPGDHSIRLAGLEEELVLSHRVWDRKVFARGALQAARFLLRVRKPGWYTMADIQEERR